MGNIGLYPPGSHGNGNTRGSQLLAQGLGKTPDGKLGGAVGRLLPNAQPAKKT